MQVIVEKKVPSIRLVAIDGSLDSFFYSNKNNFVQLEQWFSNWGPRPPGGPLDGTRGAAKKF